MKDQSRVEFFLKRILPLCWRGQWLTVEEMATLTQFDPRDIRRCMRQLKTGMEGNFTVRRRKRPSPLASCFAGLMDITSSANQRRCDCLSKKTNRCVWKSNRSGLRVNKNAEAANPGALQEQHGDEKVCVTITLKVQKINFPTAHTFLPG